jgi:putative oxidoreductase
MTDHPLRAPAGLAFHHVGIMGPALVLARFLLAAEFLTYGVRKSLHPENIYRLIEAHQLPGELVYLVIPWQVGFGLAIFLGFQTRLAAMALFGFCVIAPSIFWLDNLENLTRDYATAGGFLFLIVRGPGPISLDWKLGRNGRDLVSNRFARIWHNRLLMERLTLFGRVLIALPFLADAVRRIMYTDQGQAFLQIGGFPPSFVYGLIIVEGVGGLMLLVGYRTELTAAILLVLSLMLAFILHNPAGFLGLYTENFSTIVYNLFQRNGGPLSSFYKDVAVTGALMMLVVYGPGQFSWDRKWQELCQKTIVNPPR